MPDISVVIPVLNGADTLPEQLEAVLSQEGVEEFEIVVVDNGSTDGTVELVRGYANRDQRVRLVDAATAPRGGAAAKNRGVEAARSKLIAFCDADDLVRPGWLRGIRDGLLAQPVVIVAKEYWTLNPHLSRQYQPKVRLTGVVFGAPSISGGAFGVWKDVYLSVGGFDETFEGAVDSEFSVRMGQAGYAPVPLADAQVSVRLPQSAWLVFQRWRALARSGREVHRRYAVRDAGYSWRAVGKAGVRVLLHTHRTLRAPERFSWAQEAGLFVGRLEAILPRRSSR